TQHPNSTLLLTHLPTHPPTSIKASTQLRKLLQSSSPSPILPKMTPCPCSSHFKMTPLRTIASIARWKEMMSQEESSRAPESSHQPSPMPVSQVTNPPSSSHRAPTHPKKKKRKTRFLRSRRWIV
ncbi:hypothetical protein LINGRAHAP2_LOCUS1971, partial [Linum grandiflorum]